MHRCLDALSVQARKGVWRLQGLGGEWGVGDRDVRLPPLPPATAFRDCYEVGPLRTSSTMPIWLLSWHHRNRTDDIFLRDVFRRRCAARGSFLMNVSSQCGLY